MLICTKCACGQKNETEALISWTKNGSMPILCSKCGNIYVATQYIKEEAEESEVEEAEESEKVEAEITNKKVKIKNKNHEYHNKKGIIIDFGNGHYKIQTKNGESFWVPDHWVVPEESSTNRTKIMAIIILILALYGAFVFIKNMWGLI